MEQRDLAALVQARRVDFRSRYVTDVQVMDIIQNAEHQLWYNQVRNWAVGNVPDVIAKESRLQFQRAAALLVKIVELGFDGEKWWNVQRLGLTNDELAGVVVVLSDFGVMVEKMRASGRIIVSAIFPIVLDIILNKGWESRFQNMVAPKKAPKAVKSR